MQFDLTFELPWVSETKIEAGHSDSWFIHSAYDFE